MVKGFDRFLCDKNYTPAPDINLITNSTNLPPLTKKADRLAYYQHPVSHIYYH